MKIAFNPSTVAALITPPNNKDITFDLRGRNIFARGVKFCGTDTNTWRDIKINNVSIGSNTLDLRNGSNTTLTNTNGVVTINSTWRPVVDNLTSDSTTSSLSANLGRVLAGLINTLSTNISNLYALRDGSNATGRWRGGLACLDVRGTNYAPSDLNMGLELLFLRNNTNNLKDGGEYNGVFSFRQWSSGSDWSGGKAHLLSFTDNGNIWHRTSSGDDSWGAWKKLVYSTDIPSSLKNPYSLTTFGVVYDGSAAKIVTTSTFISLVTEGTSTITDGTMFITSYASNSGFADTNAVNVPYKRKAIHLWEYIKAKTDSLYATKGHNHDDRYLKLTGGIMTGTIYRNSGGSTISGRDHAIIRLTHAPGGSSWNPIACVDTETGTWTLGHLSSGDSDTNFHFCFSTNADYNAGNNNGNYVTLRNKVGTIALLSDIPSSLKNPHALTISLNGTSQGPYDGSSAKNINITPGSIGAATSGHNHDGRYVRYYAVTTLDCNNLTPGLTAVENTATNSAVVNHSVFLYISDVGTPFQIQIPDSNTPYIFKRSYSSGKWSGWFKLNAGYADSARSATKLKTIRNIFGLPFDGTNDIGSMSFLIDSNIDTDTSAIKWTAKIVSKYTSAYTGGQGLLIGAATDRKYCRGGGIAAYATNAWGNTTNLAIYKSQGNDYNIKPVEVITITDNFNVGIGTTSPAYKLDVIGSLRIYSTYPLLRIENSSGGTAETSIYISNGTAGWAIGVNPWGVGSGVFGIGQYSGSGSSNWRFKIDNSGYCYTQSYLNLGAGNEKNASSPPYVWGVNGSDNYLRTYATSALRVAYANSAGSASNLTVHLYLSATDATWWPLIWGGSSHNNTGDSTGAVYKSHDKLSWLTSSLTLHATNIQTNNIKNLSIGGGIYWNPYVESTTDGTDTASITLVKSGVAGGTTLVLSLMNDTNDTILFQTNGSAKLYHNSYPILTTLNTYVNNNKGYIYGNEITLVNNANLLDGLDWNNFFSRRFYTFNLSSYSLSNFYPLFFVDNDIELDCEIHSEDVQNENPYNQNRLHFQITSRGWSDTGLSFHLLSQNNYVNNEITIGSIGIGTRCGGICIWVRGGRTYRVYSNREPLFKSSNYTYCDEIYSVGTNIWGGTNTNVNLVWKNDSTRKDALIARLIDNVASATNTQNIRIDQYASTGEYPIIWADSASSNANSNTISRLYKTWKYLYWTPNKKTLTLAGNGTKCAIGSTCDTLDRPGLHITGNYPELIMMSLNVSNTNHGSIIVLGAYNSSSDSETNYRAFAIGMSGTTTSEAFLDFGYGVNLTNPHANGIANYGGGSFNNPYIMRLTASKRVFIQGIGDNLKPALLVNASRNGGWVYTASFLAPNLTSNNNNAIFIGKAHSTYNAFGLTHMHIGDGSVNNYAALEVWGAGNVLRWYYDRHSAFLHRADFSSLGSDASYMNSALLIREHGYNGAQADTWANAPRMSWHWSGRVQTQIGLASTNELYLSKDNFNHYYKLVYETGTWGINISGNATSATYPAGFTSRGTHDWSGVPGTLTTDWSVNGADIMFKYDGSKLNVITDGRFYQGIDIYGASKRVLDEYDINHTTWGYASNSDMLDGYHASAFVKIKLFRFNQYNQGTWTKILTITINSTTDLLPAIAFSWIPSECSRTIWADFSINWRSNSPIFYAIWKGMDSRTLKVVNSSGAIWDVWVSGSKTNWDPFGEIQVTYTHNITSYNGGSLEYSDTDPGGTICITGGQVNYSNSAGSATKVIVNLHTGNDVNYPLVWSNLNNSNTVTENQLYKSWSDLYYNPKNKRLTVGGSIYAAHFYESSDKALKKNIKSILSSTNIPKIREFDWKDTEEHSYGFIALELEELGYGCLVNEANGKKTVNYTATLALTVAKLLNLINIQNKKISNLTKELKALKYGRKKNS